jgi:hypothetical protein
MDHDGMVRVLEEIRWLLIRCGLSIDFHPLPDLAIVKLFNHGRILFATPKRKTFSEDVLKAGEALVQVVEEPLVPLEQQKEFDFLTFASSVDELRDRWDRVNAHDDSVKDEAWRWHEEDRYNQVEGAVRASG